LGCVGERRSGLVQEPVPNSHAEWRLRTIDTSGEQALKLVVDSIYAKKSPRGQSLRDPFPLRGDQSAKGADHKSDQGLILNDGGFQDCSIPARKIKNKRIRFRSHIIE